MPNLSIGLIYYFATPLRLDAFGIGAAIAVFNLTKWTVRPRWVVLACACALLLGLINASFGDPGLHIGDSNPLGRRFWGGLSLGYPLFLFQNRQFVWGYTVIDLASGLFIISATQANRLQQFCENRLLVYLGRISYSSTSGTGNSGLIMPLLPNPDVHQRNLFGLVCAAAVGVAHLSYFVFERHFLLLKTGFARRKDSTISSGQDRETSLKNEIPKTAPQRQD